MFRHNIFSALNNKLRVTNPDIVPQIIGRAVVRFINLGVLIVIDYPFLFLSSFLKPQVPGGLRPEPSAPPLMTALIYVVKPVKCIYIMPSVIILGNILDPFKISFDKNLGHRSYESFNQVHCFKIANNYN